jgi:hypothetical protein
VPAVNKVSVLPLRVQTLGVVPANVTASPESELALNVTGVPTVSAPGDAKVIVWLGSTAPVADATVKLLTTGTALLYVEFPSWLAVRLHVPAVIRFKVLPLTEHTTGVVDVTTTVRPEEAVADNAEVVVPKVWLPGDEKLMV